jgi:hypothetical protein
MFSLPVKREKKQYHSWADDSKVNEREKKMKERN